MAGPLWIQGKEKRRNRRGPSDRTGCAFDLQTERLLEKESCPEGKIEYMGIIGAIPAFLNLMLSVNSIF
jgi:hypothetical protein